jgi:transposase
MINIEFNEADVKALHYERYHHPHPRVQRRMEALYLKSQGLAHQEIGRLTGISGNTLRAYLRGYQRGGLETLQALHFRRPESQLMEHRASLEAYFREQPPASLKQARAVLAQETGIERSLPQVRTFLLHLGLRCRKVGMIPAKAEVEAQATFQTQQLAPRLAEAQAGARAVFFVDAAHFVLAPFLGFLWSFTRLFVQAPSGRQRFNVLGALNAVTHEVVLVTNDTYITSVQVCQLLARLAASGLSLPITLVLDNARYQRCRLVQACAARLGIELLFLPPYSPNLNLIERLWKFVKKQCLYSKYYAKFDQFRQAITDCLTNIEDKHQDELNSLLTLNFQTFEKAQVVTL